MMNLHWMKLDGWFGAGTRGLAFACATALLVVTCVTCQVARPTAVGAATTGDAPVMAVVTQFVKALNAGDLKAIAATSAASVDVVDDFAPHHWSGPGALERWATDFGRSLKPAGITAPSIVVARSRRTEIDGDHAFAPLPAVYRYRQAGKAVTETGVLVFALDRTGGAWKIVALAWAPSP